MELEQTYVGVTPELVRYVEAAVLPRYDAFDAAHRRDHVQKVIEESLRMASFYEVEYDMVFCIAAYHDIGLTEGREVHHLASGRMLRNDTELLQWFSVEQIELMAQAAEDHRASSKREPRSIYGRIVAEADRDIEPELIVRRTVQYGVSHYPQLEREEHWQRMLEHLDEKYAEGGYLKLYIPESQNAEQLMLLRDLIRDRHRLRILFEQIYDELASGMV
ncbi:MAG: HD domain-containing protein [Bacteroidales bacterium]|nr:HD domain-containing protein [Bacteroidales bacterium]